MPKSDADAAEVIAAYRRRRERTIPLLLGGLAVLLLVVGLFLIVLWLTSDRPPALPAFLSTDTPTPTETSTRVPPTATVTPSPSEVIPTDTPTPEGPITYLVQEGDTLSSIADSFEIDVLVLMSVNNIANANEIYVGQELTIPAAGAELPTATALPETLVPGTTIQYVVQPGDTLETIAAQFNSTAEAIAEENDIEDPNSIGVGQVLIVPVGIATPTPTVSPAPETPTATP